jgi:hypothetical protein
MTMELVARPAPRVVASGMATGILVALTLKLSVASMETLMARE